MIKIYTPTSLHFKKKKKKNLILLLILGFIKLINLQN
jgi:hypothetical protein